MTAIGAKDPRLSAVANGSARNEKRTLTAKRDELHVARIFEQNGPCDNDGCQECEERKHKLHVGFVLIWVVEGFVQAVRCGTGLKVQQQLEENAYHFKNLFIAPYVA